MTEIFKKKHSLRLKVDVQRNSLSSVGSLYDARGAATEKTLSPILRSARGGVRIVLEFWQRA